jgi:hypothetical protein
MCNVIEGGEERGLAQAGARLRIEKLPGRGDQAANRRLSTANGEPALGHVFYLFPDSESDFAEGHDGIGIMSARN